MQRADYLDVDHDEIVAEPGDGTRLAYVSIGLAIAGIIIPIALSIAALVVAQMAKKRLDPSKTTSLSLAKSAQLLAVIDMFGQVMFFTIFFVVYV